MTIVSSIFLRISQRKDIENEKISPAMKKRENQYIRNLEYTTLANQKESYEKNRAVDHISEIMTSPDMSVRYNQRR